MNDFIANQLTSYRTRLACLDQPAHLTLWENQPPLIFTTKVAQARAATQALADTAARQSAPTVGSAADKRREEKELEEAAHTLARAVVAFGNDTNNLTLAHTYDQPGSSWRRLRDEALLQRARLLEADAGLLANGPDAALAATYGITPASVAALKKEADDYAAFIVAPQDTIASRSALTASLPQQSRATAALFDQVEDLLPQFNTSPAGAAFLAAYRASSSVIPRGRSAKTTEAVTASPAAATA